MNYNLIPIGECKEENGEFVIEIYPKYRKAMEGLAEHSYLKIIWWFDKCDDEISRNKLIEAYIYVSCKCSFQSSVSHFQKMKFIIFCKSNRIVVIPTVKNLLYHRAVRISTFSFLVLSKICPVFVQD